MKITVTQIFTLALNFNIYYYMYVLEVKIFLLALRAYRDWPVNGMGSKKKIKTQEDYLAIQENGGKKASRLLYICFTTRLYATDLE